MDITDDRVAPSSGPPLPISRRRRPRCCHRPFRMDEWLLYAIDSPNAGGGRGFCRGQIFNQQGELVVSVAQEGLIRKLDLSAKK